MVTPSLIIDINMRTHTTAHTPQHTHRHAHTCTHAHTCYPMQVHTHFCIQTFYKLCTHITAISVSLVHFPYSTPLPSPNSSPLQQFQLFDEQWIAFLWCTNKQSFGVQVCCHPLNTSFGIPVICVCIWGMCGVCMFVPAHTCELVHVCVCVCVCVYLTLKVCTRACFCMFVHMHVCVMCKHAM